MIENTWHQRSQHNVAKTLTRLEDAIARDPDIVVLARIDLQDLIGHSGGKSAPAKMLLFADAKQAASFYKIGAERLYDLPNRVLVYEDDKGATWVKTYDPDRLAKDLGLDSKGVTITTIRRLVSYLVEIAVGVRRVDGKPRNN